MTDFGRMCEALTMSSPMFAWLMPKMDSNPRGLNFIVKILSDEKLLRSSVVLLRTRMSSFLPMRFVFFPLKPVDLKY